MVIGSEIPESTNSLLLILAAETVTEVPLAIRLQPSAALEPTVTLPKLRHGQLARGGSGSRECDIEWRVGCV